MAGSAMLEQQKRGWEMWLSRPDDVDLVPAEKSIFRGLSCMWDEAGQKIRAILASRFSSGQSVVEVLVTLAVLWESRVFDAVTKRR